MIGTVVYRLRAENQAVLPAFHGRLLHAVAFNLLKMNSETVAEYAHDHMTLKPFTVSLLQSTKRRKNYGGILKVHPGDVFLWRVTLWKDGFDEAFCSIPIHTRLNAGEARLLVEEVLVDGRQNTGLIEPAAWFSSAMAYQEADRIDFHFSSPVSFRQDDRDYPLPRPEYIFASLADKWTWAGMPGDADRNEIGMWASKIQVLEWIGKTQRVRFAQDRGMLAFMGDYSYGVRDLPEIQRKKMVILAKFAELSGVGRLTAQGFGSCSVVLSGTNTP